MVSKDIISRDTNPLERILHSDQNTGIVRDGLGNVVGREKWLINLDFSLDSLNQDYIVNAATEEEAITLVDELLLGEAKRKQMSLGMWFINAAAPVRKL